MDAYQDDGAPGGLSVLGDPTRRTIVELLARRPRSVGELAGELPVSRPAVSQHLRALKEAGLVADRAHGTRRVYHLDPDAVAALRTYLDRLWGDALTALKDLAEAPRTEAPRTEPPGTPTSQEETP